MYHIENDFGIKYTLYFQNNSTANKERTEDHSKLKMKIAWRSWSQTCNPQNCSVAQNITSGVCTNDV